MLRTQRVLSNLLQLVNTAINLAERNDISWKFKYEMIFSVRISQQISILLQCFSLKLDYYDPDTSYEDDVKAYIRALEELKPQLVAMADSLAEAQAS